MNTPRWYMVNKMGMATLCANKADAQQEAADAQRFWPHMGPHRAVLAKWGSPQPVVREPLTDAQIAEMMRDTWGCASIAPRHALEFARAIEAEVRKQDEALIRQLVEALAVATTPLAKDRQEVLAAIAAARARLEWLGKLDQHLEGLAAQ